MAGASSHGKVVTRRSIWLKTVEDRAPAELTTDGSEAYDGVGANFTNNI